MNGRPPTLSKSEINIISEYIKKRHTNQSCAYFPSFSELSDYIFINFGKVISQDTLRHLFYTNLTNELKTYTGEALDQERYEANLKDIEENLMILKEKIDGLPSCFVFNCDEVGHSEFADSPQKILIVPKSYRAKVAPYPATKSGKHTTCIACISPVGIACKPLFTVPRVTIDPELYTRLPLDTLDIVRTDSGYVNTVVFHYWLTDIFIPYLKQLRREKEYDGKAVLIMDGFLGHVNAIETLDLEAENLEIHYLVPHTSDMLQPLDVGIFASMKRFLSNCKTPSDFSPQSKQIFKMHKSLYQAACPSNCKSAFKATGVVTKIVQEGESFVEKVYLNFEKCEKVRFFDISYIETLKNSNYHISEIQNEIYLHHLHPNVQKATRIRIDNYGSTK